MVDTSRIEALTLCRALEDGKAGDVQALGLGVECSWASFLIIATVTSRVHMKGLARTVKETAEELDLPLRAGVRREDNDWLLIDGGDIVVNLMTREARDFYALEDRWFEAERAYGSSSNSS